MVAALPRVGRFAELAAWAVVAFMMGVVVTQVAGINGLRIVAAVQSVTPYLLTLALPIGALALVFRRWPLAIAALVVASAIGAYAWPLLHPDREPAALAGSTPVRVFHANLLFENDDTDGIVRALGSVDADLLAFTEFTRVHSTALLESPLADEYPYRIHLYGARASGSALWSRYPLEQLADPPIAEERMLVRVDAPTPFVLYVVHTTSPIVNADDLRAEVGELAASTLGDDGPTLMVGDFNAGYWHPIFRDLLDAGWRDAHTALGRGFSNSWPDHLPLVPPFVRLDHALLNDELTAQAIHDVPIPGSDHIGFVVTVAPAA